MGTETSLRWSQSAVALAGAVSATGYHSAAVPLDSRAIPSHAPERHGAASSVGPRDASIEAAYSLGGLFFQRQATVQPHGVWEMSRVVPLTALSCPWTERSLRRIRDLAAMPDDWDTYGSPRIHPAAVNAAIQLLRRIAPFDPPAPHIVPTSGGGLQMEWGVGRRELEIGVAPDGTIDYLKDEDDDMEGGDIALNDTRRVAEIVAWLRGEDTASTSVG